MDDRWVTSARFFIPALSRIMPPGSMLYLESYSPRSEFLAFVRQHHCDASECEEVYKACLDPAPSWTAHLRFDEALVGAFERFFGRWNFPFADDVHGYHAGELIFWFTMLLPEAICI